MAGAPVPAERARRTEADASGRGLVDETRMAREQDLEQRFVTQAGQGVPRTRSRIAGRSHAQARDVLELLGRQAFPWIAAVVRMADRLCCAEPAPLVRLQPDRLREQARQGAFTDAQQD